MAKPAPSEWGKLSAGQAYLPWAVDVARAVFSAGLGPNTGLLFWHVLECSWGGSRKTKAGWPDPVPVQVSYTELAALWSLDRQTVYRAKQWLVKARLLIENEAGLWVNKAADQWVRPEDGSPLLAASRLAYAKAGRTRTSKPEQPLPCKRPRLQEGVSPSAPALTTNDCMSAPVTTPVSAGAYDGKRRRLQDTIEERARDKFSSNDSKVVVAAAASTFLDPETPDGVPPIPDPNHDLLNMRPGPHRLTTEEVTRIWRALHTHFNPDDAGARKKLAIEFFEHHERFSFKAWLGALTEMRNRETYTIWSINYLTKIAASIDAGTHRPTKRADTIQFPGEQRPQSRPARVVTTADDDERRYYNRLAKQG